MVVHDPARGVQRRPSFRGIPAGTEYRAQYIVEPAVEAGRPWHHGARGDGRGPAQGPLPAHRKGHRAAARSEEHTSELQSLMRISYAVFCLKIKNHYIIPILLIPILPLSSQINAQFLSIFFIFQFITLYFLYFL